jgi:hypothetical protein
VPPTHPRGRRFPLVEAEMVDEAKLNQFIGQMLGDLGGALSVSMVRMGDLP